MPIKSREFPKFIECLWELEDNEMELCELGHFGMWMPGAWCKPACEGAAARGWDETSLWHPWIFSFLLPVMTSDLGYWSKEMLPNKLQLVKSWRGIHTESPISSTVAVQDWPAYPRPYHVSNLPLLFSLNKLNVTFKYVLHYDIFIYIYMFTYIFSFCFHDLQRQRQRQRIRGGEREREN